jgi:hypothetical protein
MGRFLTPVSISNRALQHVGGSRIDETQGFAEDSKNASECAFCYDKLRRYELQRATWAFATKRVILRAIDTDTMILAPALWSSQTTYFVGSIVSDETGTLWISNTPNNLGYQPENSLTWDQYCGPMTVSLYDSATTYSAGELVYTTGGDGIARVYLSLEDGNADNPATATDYDATVTYRKNQVVTYLTVAYMSRIDLNLNNAPNLAPADWESATVYAAAATVTGSDGLIYSSVQNGNTANDPTLDDGTWWTSTGVLSPWTTVFTSGTGSIKWLQVGGPEFPMGVGLITSNIIYPIGAGPSSQEATRNVYRFPAGYLRKLSADPKAGSQSYFGAPTNRVYDDWLFEGRYIITQDVGPIMLRFVADTVDVPNFHDMFCEGLAARMGYEICEPITQSTTKRAVCKDAYKQAMGDARLVNAIEVGSEEAPLDDFLAVRA